MYYFPSFYFIKRVTEMQVKFQLTALTESLHSQENYHSIKEVNYRSPQHECSLIPLLYNMNIKCAHSMLSSLHSDCHTAILARGSIYMIPSSFDKLSPVEQVRESISLSFTNINRYSRKLSDNLEELSVYKLSLKLN